MKATLSGSVVCLSWILVLYPTVISAQGFFWPNPVEEAESDVDTPAEGDNGDNGTPNVAHPYLNGMNYMYGYPYQQEVCSCNCNNLAPTAEGRGLGCEWKMVFKAVKGNSRHVYDDWMISGSMNLRSAEAMEVTSSMPYRDGDVLDNWNQIYVERVKVEIFSLGVRKTWFYFDATASDKETWMTRDRLIASPYSELKSETFDAFSVAGETGDERRFLINKASPNCAGKCGYLMVVDPQSSHECTFERAEEEPFFIYGTNVDACGYWSDSGENSIGDRFVISLKVCDLEL